MSAADVMTQLCAWLDDQPAYAPVRQKLEDLIIEDAQRTVAADCLALDFAAFWQAYPRKVAKAAADRAWRKLRPSPILFAEIMVALDLQKRQVSWQHEDGRYIPHAATWLHGRRWEDQLGPLVTDLAAITRAEQERSQHVIAEREALLKGGQ